MALASQARSSHLSSRLRRRHLRKLSAELARLETAAKAARSERQRLEHAHAQEIAESAAEAETYAEGRGAQTGASRTDQLLAAARRREDALRIAIGDCRAEIFKELVRGARWEDD